VPQLDEGSFATFMIRTTSIGLDASPSTCRSGRKGSAGALPGGQHTFSRIGTAEVATDPMGVNVADTYIFYSPFENGGRIERADTPTKDELATLMAEELTRAARPNRICSRSPSRCASTKSSKARAPTSR
jgi:cobalt-zinc-cadmium resistance protein CzcA